MTDEQRSELRERRSRGLRFGEEDDCVEHRAFERRRIVGGFEAGDAQSFSDHAQTLRIDGAHMFGICIVDGDLGDRGKRGGEQAADGSAADDQHMGGHGFFLRQDLIRKPAPTIRDHD